MKPMLSATLKNEDEIKFPVLLSPKLDGIRCVILNGIPVTRNFKHVPNRAVFNALKGLKLPPLDGELIVGDPTAEDCYRTTNSGIMSQDGEPDWVYHVFDEYHERRAFEVRLAEAKRFIRKLGHPRIKIVPHIKARSIAEVDDYEAKMLKAGYEGIMGRDPLGYYKSGRSTMREGGLWKLKRFVDGEA
jgi:DNA ligase-1